MLNDGGGEINSIFCDVHNINIHSTLNIIFNVEMSKFTF